MPAKDKYHDHIVRALRNAGLFIAAETQRIRVGRRNVYPDIIAETDEALRVIVEVKNFEESESPVRQLRDAVGQVLLYEAALRVVQRDYDVYLSVPIQASDTFFREPLTVQLIDDVRINLVIIDIVEEKVIEWRHRRRS
jgi:predicted oxidoreductase (fatty acid repression mutant protein)